jgi:hypothetical protein
MKITPARLAFAGTAALHNTNMPPATNRHLAVLVATGLAACVAVVAAPPDFSRQVRPLLETHCVKCHGPEKQKGGLRFDTKAGAFATADSGEKAIVPGHASQSRLVKLVSSRKDDERMPPKGEPLSPRANRLAETLDRRRGGVARSRGGQARQSARGNDRDGR